MRPNNSIFNVAMKFVFISCLALIVYSCSGGGGGGSNSNRIQGQLVNSPVQGLDYRSGSLSGDTDSQGFFYYEEGSSVQFYVGDIIIGEAVANQDGNRGRTRLCA